MVWRISGGLLVFVAILAAWTLADAPGQPGQPGQPGDGKPGGAPRSSNPFAGTPAEAYPVGAAGIEMPMGAQVDGWSRAQIDGALVRVKQALIAGHLDRRMLVDRETDHFVSLFARDARSDLKSTFMTGAFKGAAVRVAPGARLASQPPRVTGSTTVDRSVDDSGLERLEIVTNHVWVYPFIGASPRPGDRLVVVHDKQYWWVYRRSDVDSGSRGLWLGRSEAYAYNVDCALPDKQLIAPTPPSQRLHSADAPAEMYDPTHPLTVEGTCPG